MALSDIGYDQFSGYLFMQEGATIRYLTGSKVQDSDQLKMLVWKGGEQERFAMLERGQKNSWSGETNLSMIQFSRSIKEVKSLSMGAQYKGTLGTSQASLALEWSDEVNVSGNLLIDGEKKYVLKGDNSIPATIFMNVYESEEPKGVVLLKRSENEAVSWTGICHFNDGKETLLAVSR